jgi:hypothetical protein
VALGMIIIHGTVVVAWWWRSHSSSRGLKIGQVPLDVSLSIHVSINKIPINRSQGITTNKQAQKSPFSCSTETHTFLSLYLVP